VIGSPVLLAWVILKILHRPAVQENFLKPMMGLLKGLCMLGLAIALPLAGIAALVIFVKWIWYTF